VTRWFEENKHQQYLFLEYFTTFEKSGKDFCNHQRPNEERQKDFLFYLLKPS